MVTFTDSGLVQLTSSCTEQFMQTMNATLDSLFEGYQPHEQQRNMIEYIEKGAAKMYQENPLANEFMNGMIRSNPSSARVQWDAAFSMVQMYELLELQALSYGLIAHRKGYLSSQIPIVTQPVLDTYVAEFNERATSDQLRGKNILESLQRIRSVDSWMADFIYSMGERTRDDEKKKYVCLDMVEFYSLLEKQSSFIQCNQLSN